MKRKDLKRGETYVVCMDTKSGWHYKEVTLRSIRGKTVTLKAENDIHSGPVIIQMTLKDFLEDATLGASVFNG